MREAPRSTPVSYLEWALSQAQAAFADENPHLAESIARAILEGIPASASHLPRAIFARIRADALAIAAVEARSANEPWPVSQARRSYQIAQRAFQRAAYAWQSTVCFAKARALLTRTDDEQGSQLWLPGMRPAEAEVPAVRIGYRARRCIGFRLAIGAADTPGRAEKTRERAFFTHLGSLDCDDRRLAGWLSGARSMQTKPAVALHDVSGDGSRAILEATLDDEHLVLLGAAGAGAPFKADAEHVVVSVRSDSHHATPSVISTRIGRTAEFQLIANHDGPLRGEVLFRMPGGVAVRACIGDVQAKAMRHERSWPPSQSMQDCGFMQVRRSKGMVSESRSYGYHLPEAHLVVRGGRGAYPEGNHFELTLQIGMVELNFRSEGQTFVADAVNMLTIAIDRYGMHRTHEALVALKHAAEAAGRAMFNEVEDQSTDDDSAASLAQLFRVLRDEGVQILYVDSDDSDLIFPWDLLFHPDMGWLGETAMVLPTIAGKYIGLPVEDELKEKLTTNREHFEVRPRGDVRLIEPPTFEDLDDAKGELLKVHFVMDVPAKSEPEDGPHFFASLPPVFADNFTIPEHLS